MLLKAQEVYFPTKIKAIFFTESTHLNRTKTVFFTHASKVVLECVKSTSAWEGDERMVTK
jgi:hypothetical protein